jgi:hypothetical protein
MAGSSNDTRLGDYHFHSYTHSGAARQCLQRDRSISRRKQSVASWKYFVFGSLKEISFAHPGTIFQPVLQRRPGNSDFFALFPNLAGKAQLA